MVEVVTLKENKDFRRLYGRGRSFVSPVVVTYVMKNRSKQLRYGITTSKKTGKAVQRNRSRRLIRESFLRLSSRVRPGYDFVFVARGRTPYVKCEEVLGAMEIQLRQAGVLK